VTVPPAIKAPYRDQRLSALSDNFRRGGFVESTRARDHARIRTPRSISFLR
jgi:hypothetical protein